jgi:hypothetical protein
MLLKKTLLARIFIKQGIAGLLIQLQTTTADHAVMVCIPLSREKT